MKRCMLLVLAVALVISCPAARAQDMDALLAQMQSADAGLRMAAVDGIAQADAAAIAPLFDLLEGENRDAGVAARLAIQKITYAASAPDASDRPAVAEALAEVASSSMPVAARRYALRMLSFVGRDEAVPTLARLLRDAEVREMARWALVRLPGEAATRALADALPGAEGEFKAGLIAALAERGSAEPARSALNDDDPVVRIAAIQALGRVADPASEPALRGLLSGAGREGDAARDAYLRLAGVLVAAGDRTLAAQMFERRSLAANSEHEQCAALAGLAQASGTRALPVLVRALDGAQPAVAAAAGAALVALPGDDATRMIAGAMPSSGRAQHLALRLISILGERGDPAALPALRTAARRGPAETREASLRAMGEIGDPAAVPALVAALGAREEAVRTAAGEGLIRLQGEEATRAIAAALDSAPAGARAEGVRALGYRRDVQALPAVIAAMRNTDPGVRLAGIEAAGELGAGSATRVLLDRLRAGSEAERDAAQAALGRMRTQRAREAMVAALEGAPAGMRARLVRALGQRPDPGLLPLYASAARDANEDVALAGLEALGILRDERAAPVFVELAQDKRPRVGAAAASGYLRLSAGVFDREPEQAAAIARQGLGLPGDDDRRLALSAVAHLRDAGAVPLVLPLLGAGPLRQEAASAVLAIGDGLAGGDKEQAIHLYRQVLERSSDTDRIRQAVSRLRGLDVDVDPAADAGFVTYWWVIGPFKGYERLMKEDPIPVVALMDVSKKVEADGATFQWRPAHVDDPLGRLDLEEAVERRVDCGAYMYAEVTSDRDRDVLLKIGSDDDMVCWLNGTQVHAFWGGRGYAPDQEVVAARLRAGANGILLKVLNRGGQWAGGLRITDPDGKPLKLQQKTP